MASCVLFCFALCVFSSHQILANADLTPTVCSKTLYKDVCESTFAEIPASKTADLNGLAEMALNAAIKQGKDIQLKILELAKSNKANEQRLNDCSNQYQQAIVECGKSLEALETKRYFDINTWVSAGMSAGDTCKDGLGDGASSLEDLNKKFKGICSIVLTISNQLASKA